MSRLPGETHLAAELGVARGTIRRALSQLATQGRLIRRPHAGFLVAPGIGGEAVLHGTVVLVTASGSLPIPFAEDYPAAAVIGAQRAAAAAGVHLMLVATDRWDAATQERIAAQRPTAVIIEDILSAEHSAIDACIARLKQAGIPVICHADPDDLASCDCTAADQAQGGRLLVELCLRHGRSRPLLLESAEPTLPWWMHRRTAILGAWQAGGVTARSIQVETDGRPYFRNDANFRKRTRLFAGYLGEELAAGHRPDVIFVCSDADVPVVIAACRLLGLDPNHEVDILGFDGFWSRLWERELEPQPPRASVRANHLQVGMELMALALRTNRQEVPLVGTRVPVELMTYRTA